jgi:predicted acylesterase/phospholipase RssA
LRGLEQAFATETIREAQSFSVARPTSVLTQRGSDGVTTYKEKDVLALQGGGALGAYQAGAYEALCDAGRVPRWVAGTSIGAINAAIIAGNRPEHRVSRLRQFWEGVSTSSRMASRRG